MASSARACVPARALRDRGATSSFVGRTADLAALAARLAAGPMVSLLGPPGIGKTRLALEHARRHGAAHAGGAVFCDLTSARDGAELLTAVARALDVAPARGRGEGEADVIAAIGRALGERGDVLLILDNLEHLVRPATPAIEAWLAAAPAARLLVTSRLRVGLAAEEVFDLGPLSLPGSGTDAAGSEAVQLFVARARAVRRDFALDADNHDHVAALVRELDGLPLAIELCAARVRVLSPSQLRSRLARRFELLRRDDRDGLWEAIQSSWELLSPAEAEALAACSVFAGSFDVDAAEAVIGGVDRLQALVDSSLVATSDANLAARAGDLAAREDRFALYVSIRDHAAEMLDRARRTGEVKRRHAEHYARVGGTWAEAVRRQGSVAALEALSRERDNLLTAYQWATAAAEPALALELALSLAPVLTARGPLIRGVELLDTAAGCFVDPMPPPTRVRYLEGRVQALSLISEVASRRASCEEGLALAIALGDRSRQALFRSELGDVCMRERDLDGARHHLEQALALFRSLGDRRGEGIAFAGLGNVTYIGERFAEAARHYQRAVQCHRESGDRLLECNALYLLGTAHLDAGDLDHGRRNLERATAVFEETGDRRWIAYSVGFLAIIDQEQGRFDAARTGYERAIAEAQRFGATTSEGFLGGYLGNCLLEQGEFAHAAAVYEHALHVMRRQPHSWQPLIQGCAAAAHALAGDPLQARERLDEATAATAGAPADGLHRTALGYLAAIVDLAAAIATTDPAADARRAAAVERFAAPLARDPAQSDVRFARRLLGRVIDGAGVAASTAHDADGDRLMIARTGVWFRTPGGDTIKLYRRRPLARILSLLATARESSPGVALPLTRLIEAGWPGEIIQPTAAAARVYSAVASLRRLGLRALLVSIDDGYALDPSVDASVVDAS